MIVTKYSRLTRLAPHSRHWSGVRAQPPAPALTPLPQARVPEKLQIRLLGVATRRPRVGAQPRHGLRAPRGAAAPHPAPRAAPPVSAGRRGHQHRARHVPEAGRGRDSSLLQPVVAQQVARGRGEAGARGPAAHVVLGREEVPGAALAVDLGQVAGGDEPGVVRAGALRVDAVAAPGLVPEDEAGGGVAPALRAPLRLVVLEHEAGRAGAAAVPLVARAVLGPVVLVVSRAAAAVAAVTLAGVGLEHDKLAQGARALAPHLVAVALAGVRRGGEVKVSLGAGVLRTEADSVIALD